MTKDRGELTIRGRRFKWGERTYLMGILNVTPDSFSDGGEFNTLDAALKQGQFLVEAGADILDVGGQSTRPGATEVPLEEELARVVPVVRALSETLSVPISVDTTRAEVARAAVEAGASLVNDISAATFDPQMLSVVAELGVPLILMHIRGTPQTMQQLTDYKDLIAEILQFLDSRIQAAQAAGIPRKHLLVDPGIGFAKTFSQNLEILRRLGEFHTLNCPLLVGPSRKSFIGHILNQPNPKARVWGTAAACCAAIAAGADLLRVHDVQQMQEVCRVADAIFRF
ncbi:MAG: dihydropteroate synthase [Oscillatoriaceae bacterium SKW80]|nr:dihydropteroate synthase [Oscillatoriaceae bacterium SKYG93]MCX8120588.1 dihydropteroate synthase [Oscillatoriaceae bacterium SKW80]MDW8453875.1 dihydropteroate synthase [Oscillatoriaceae cyanobacterium SKYGB_i_bin93]HIK27104.1 dihydropteroate synthase [Oscillatoriaceae cyanobacterium M7585_C2015_266]